MAAGPHEAEWRMSLLRLTKKVGWYQRLTRKVGKKAGWYHLSIANPAWVLRQIPETPNQSLDKVKSGQIGDFPQGIQEHYRIDYQISVEDAAKQAGFPKDPGLKNTKAWITIVGEQERRFGGEAPKPWPPGTGLHQHVQQVVVGVAITVLGAIILYLLGIQG